MDKINAACTPPKDSPFSSPKDYRKYQLNKEYVFSLSMITIFVLLFIPLIILILYFTCRLLKTILKYYKERKNKQQNKNKNLQEFGSDLQKFLNYKNDNNEVIDHPNKNKTFENEKDYTDAIQKSIEKFQKYNYKIQQFFKSNYNESAPDMINKHIFNEKYDNW